MKNIFSKHISFIMLLGIAIGFASCTKMNDYQEYTKSGEISYTGKIDSLKIFPGHDRVLVKGLFISDPKVKSLRIYWNNRRDSVVIPVTRTNGVDTLKRILTGLSEGTQNFEVFTYDGLGNPSIIVRASANVYGERYTASLINRPIASVELGNDGNTTVDWGDVDKTTGVLSSEIVYTKTNGTTATVKVPVASAQTILPSYKYGSTFTYHTGYLPDTLSIDTFYTADAIINVKTNVTEDFIINPGKMDPKSATGQKFQPVSLSEGAVVAGNAATWRKLAGWISNAQANNWGTGFGTYGTWVERTAETIANFGTLSLEAGKNTTTPALNVMTNGKIYQTKLLPAGEYTFEARVGNAGANSAMYLVASAGSELPDIEVFTSKPSNSTFAGQPTDAAYFPITVAAQGYNVSVNFTIQQPTQVSFGFVATLKGTTTTNQFLKISGVRMKSLAY
ncbi:DUF4998 domain-containing protein [Pedobacter psychroterrae]|uniref:DUF5013 domain-containing protein n=1 Tax=Pedobacter psychroterrae TaxID=2530453 RepID=A0A4V2MKP2_9SPHI|nr:DUF4998 domain-containing protein [Pedobacter psychroterrae]TCC99026.1 DUF5013 domain-containing protein [Pedobacter psychroterrae]